LFDALWYEWQVDPEAAALLLEDLRRGMPFDATVIGIAAAFRWAEGDRASATCLVDEALSLDPSNLAALRAEVLANCSEQYAEISVERAGAALEFHPGDIWLLTVGATAALMIGRDELARRWSNEAVRLHGDSPVVLALAGRVELLSGDPATAETWLRAALALVEPEDAPSRWNEDLSVALHQQRRHEEALRAKTAGGVTGDSVGASAQAFVYANYVVLALVLIVGTLASAFTGNPWLIGATIVVALVGLADVIRRVRRLDPVARSAFLSRELGFLTDRSWKGVYLRWFFGVAAVLILGVIAYQLWWEAQQ
jgi:hypothetical protein